jgi:hypothetical protein
LGIFKVGKRPFKVIDIILETLNMKPRGNDPKKKRRKSYDLLRTFRIDPSSITCI